MANDKDVYYVRGVLHRLNSPVVVMCGDAGEFAQGTFSLSDAKSAADRAVAEEGFAGAYVVREDAAQDGLDTSLFDPALAIHVAGDITAVTDPPPAATPDVPGVVNVVPDIPDDTSEPGDRKIDL